MLDKESMYYCTDCSGENSLVFHPSTSMSTKLRFPESASGRSNGPLTYGTLKNFIRRYCVREFRGLFVYVPRRDGKDDPEALSWLRALMLCNALIAGPWTVRYEWVRKRLESEHSYLLSSDTTEFTIYRLDISFLNNVLGR
ncbi:MAG: hypothetical protein OEU92_33460 [Alphaproteobacteria bacterium]|nr:hypothetical protein [Alphaproteobacteria bacterium]